MANLTNVIYLSNAQYNTIINGGTVSGYTYDPNAVYLVPADELVNHLYRHQISFHAEGFTWDINITCTVPTAATTKEAISQLIDSAVNMTGTGIIIERHESGELGLEILYSDGENSIYTIEPGNSYGTLSASSVLTSVTSSIIQII